MTTLRIEVGRSSGTTVEDVVKGLRLAGCMKSLEIDPDAMAFLPIDELKAALEDELFHVELRPWPEPPPLPLWRRVRWWPRRVYRWGRRLVLRESEMDQFMADMADTYASPAAERIHALSTRESPLLRKMREAEPSARVSAACPGCGCLDGWLTLADGTPLRCVWCGTAWPVKNVQQNPP